MKALRRQRPVERKVLTRPGKKPLFTEQTKRRIISFLIVAHIIAILLGSSRLVPTPSSVQSFFHPYLWWTRLEQDWKLFVPTPRIFSIRYHVDIDFKNGKHIRWQRPYPPKWGFFQRMLCYHFQKWDLASNRIDVYPS